MAKWSTAQINDLPDSSFAFIEPGGTKDSDGKTTPRSLRHLPYKDAGGAVDHNHASNALARLDQTQNIPDSDKAAIRTKLQNALKDMHSSGDLDDTEITTLSAAPIKLDASGDLPTRVPLFTTFDLPNSNRGHFTVDVDDLQQMKDHFDAKLGFPTEDGSTGLPVDFEHRRSTEEAAAWIKGLELVKDPSDPKKATLFANPMDWTSKGAQAIRDGLYKMISPTGAFGKKNGKLSVYAHHTNLDNRLPNLLMGAGLVNEPFQSMMAPIRMGAKDSDLHTGYDNVIYVYDVQEKKEPSMNLAALRVKERDELSVPELDYLGEHKDELSAPERTKFKLEAAATDTKDQLSQEDKDLLAAVKSGDKKVVDGTAEAVSKDSLSRMESTIERYRKQEVTDLLDKHVKRGAIKQDAAKLDGFWGKQLLDASGDSELQAVKDALEALPSNEQLAKEHGTGEDLHAGSTGREQLHVLAQKAVDEAAKNGKTLLYADALKKVYRENSDLRTQDVQEQKTKAGVLNAVGA